MGALRRPALSRRGHLRKPGAEDPNDGLRDLRAIAEDRIEVASPDRERADLALGQDPAHRADAPGREELQVESLDPHPQREVLAGRPEATAKGLAPSPVCSRRRRG